MAIKDLFKTVGGDPTLGLGDSKTVQDIAGNMSLGKVVDGLDPDAMTAKIKKDALAGVIQYEGGNETFIWKHPLEDFNTGSQLIVHESQEAIFFMNGQALDLFGPGRHTLATQNLPLVGRFFKAATGGVTPFHCEVYFINKTEQLAIKWGTDTRLTYVDPVYSLPIQIGASGEMSLRVEDSRKLLVKIVGTEKGISQQGFTQKMRGFLMEGIKAHLANFIKREQLNIFTIDEHLPTIADALREVFKPDFLDYGVAMERFKVTSIVKHEDDNYRKLMELQTATANKAIDQINVDRGLIRYEEQVGKRNRDTDADAYRTERLGEAEAHRLKSVGMSKQEEMALEAAQIMAGNEAVGQMTNTGLGLGMMAGVGMGVGGAVGGMVQDTMGKAFGGAQPGQPASDAAVASGAASPCAKCGKPLPQGAKFCLECGEQVLADNEAVCPSCGAKTPKGKFCLECGAAMAKKCPDCGTEIPPSGKFCLECGHKFE
jgi:membrane protease subunit (stomatin/prohibitin family)